MDRIMKLLMWPIFHLYLKPKIIHNYRMRAISAICKNHGVSVKTPDGNEYPDEWFWADKLASSYGYFVDYDRGIDPYITRCLQKNGHIGDWK